MRNFTDTQKREITSNADCKLLVESSGEGFYFISQQDTGSDLAYYTQGLEISDFEQSVDWLGGMSTISDLNIEINNSDNKSDFLDLDFETPNYLENEEIDLIIKVKDIEYTIYRGVISDWKINRDIWELTITDETVKFDIDILEPINDVIYEPIHESAKGSYVPLLYCLADPGTISYFPGLNIRKGKYEIIYANHVIDNAGEANFILYIYIAQIDSYILLHTFTNKSENNSTYASTEFLDARGRLSSYRRMNSGSHTTPSITIDNLFDSDVTNAVSISDNKQVAIKFDLIDLGHIYDYATVSVGFKYTNLEGNVYARLYNADTGNTSNPEALSGISHGYDPFTSDITFNDLYKFEWEIYAEAGEENIVDLQDASFNVDFILFQTSPLSPMRYK